ncbi:Rpn family recombination-promoting nuclease/putative transposase [Anaerovorax odorimutans]|uniref:Rpn family recombination-promoting nuclease/putative transposase n=1 Tax=Anaerovorax odorimutans TaxID=109327 RepID=A0ABT1RM32_9FIRM|nr:Rpn family recombination-promoting nuclease/putative transposase [Anaerovorax odorimutans]MCQ4636238.1 Rpn family recombination-promoting nuclease/putative transposase [Anaerovorax odorimutans]
MKKVKRTYKDGIFRQLFNEKEKILELYNALSGNNYPKGTPIEIITLEDAIFGDLKNDLAFIIHNRLIVLIEHQSTVNPNMPLRMLGYIAKEYERLTYSRAIYSKRLLPIPTPELYVFYNGEEPQPLEQELKISDAFLEKCGKITLEVVVKVINVNYDKGAEVLKRCQTLREYSQFVSVIRGKWKESGELEAAIKESIEACIDQGVLREFLKKNGGDIVSFLYEELSREECEAIREEDGYEKGKSEGIQKARRIFKLHMEGKSPQEIARLCDERLETVKEILDIS